LSLDLYVVIIRITCNSLKVKKNLLMIKKLVAYRDIFHHKNNCYIC